MTNYPRVGWKSEQTKMETSNRATAKELIINLIVGTVLGIILTVVLGTMGTALYVFGPACVCALAVPIFWMPTAIGGVASAVSWFPLGALIGASYALYRLHKSRGISKKLVYPAGGVLLVLGLVVLGLLLAPPGRQDRTIIAARYTELYESYNNGEYEKTYSLMSPTYRQAYTIGEFQSDFDFLDDFPGEQLGPDHSIRFSGSKAYLYPNGQWWIVGFFGGGYMFELEKLEGVWYFTGEYEFLVY